MPVFRVQVFEQDGALKCRATHPYHRVSKIEMSNITEELVFIFLQRGELGNSVHDTFSRGNWGEERSISNGIGKGWGRGSHGLSLLKQTTHHVTSKYNDLRFSGPANKTAIISSHLTRRDGRKEKNRICKADKIETGNAD